MKNRKTKKPILVAITLFIIALFAYSVYSAFYVFDDYKTEEVLLYSILISLCNASIIFLYTLFDVKHRRSALGKAIATAITAVMTATVCFGTVYGLKETYLSDCVGRLTTAFACMIFGISLAIYINSFSRSSHKVLFKALAAVLAIALLGEGIFSAATAVSAYSPLKPFYSLTVTEKSIGGTATHDSKIVYDFALSTEKPLRNTKLGTDTEMSISLAKNEFEGFQIFFSTAANGKKVSLEVSDFKNADGAALKTTAYKEIYTEVHGQGDKYCCEYADALIPVSFSKEPYGGAASLEKGLMQGFYIRTYSGKNAAAGKYTAVMTAKNEKGETILQKDITATVMNFTLPETPSTATAMGNTSWGNSFYLLNNVDPDNEEAKKQLDIDYYNYLLDNKISPYFIPYDILDERADAYMSDPRLTSFEIPYPEDDELLVKYYTKVMSNPEWAKKGYFYPIDEPTTTEAYERYIEITDRLNRLCPGYNMVTPFNTNTDIEINEKKLSAVEIQAGRSSILCPLSNLLSEDDCLAQYNSAVKGGNTPWWYVCSSPQGDYCNFFMHQDAIKHRILFWQEKANNISGLLFWSVVYYEMANPWESSKTWNYYECSGDGCLIYPGGFIGLDEPVGTLRMMNITDGIEDFDYLTLAQQRFGNEWVDEKIQKISSSLTEYTSDHKLLESVRNEIGTALSK